jgi:hypothetical protein
VAMPCDVSFLSLKGGHRVGLQERSRSMDPEGLSTGIRRMIGQFTYLLAEIVLPTLSQYPLTNVFCYHGRHVCGIVDAKGIWGEMSFMN